MRVVEGFNLPEPSDSPILWRRTGEVAVWDKSAAAWKVTGDAHAFGSPRNLVTTFGNDWVRISGDQLPEVR